MMKKTLLTAVVLATLATSALAADPTYYVGAQGGYGELLYPGLNVGGGANASTMNLMYGANVGTLTAPNGKNVSYGLELGYTNYGQAANIQSFKANDTAVQSSSFNYLGVIQWEASNGVTVIGKAGIAYMMQQTVGPVFINGVTTTVNSTQYLPMFAAGLGYDLAKMTKMPLSVNVLGQYVVSNVYAYSTPLTTTTAQPSAAVMVDVRYTL